MWSLVFFWAFIYDPAGVVQSPKTPESRKYEKITRKKYKIPDPRSPPENTKKLPKKYKKGNFSAIFVFFR